MEKTIIFDVFRIQVGAGAYGSRGRFICPVAAAGTGGSVAVIALVIRRFGAFSVIWRHIF